jgi:hypothetical protein
MFSSVGCISCRPDWNDSRLVRNNIQEEVSKLKKQPGKGMVILGSARPASFLLAIGPRG